MVEGAPIQIVGHFKIYPGSPPPLVFFLFPSRQTRVCARVPLDAGKRESCRWREEKGRGEKKKKKGGRKKRKGRRASRFRRTTRPTPNYLKYTGEATFSDIYN